MLQSLCDDRGVTRVGDTSVRVVTWTGPASCVHGDTRIDDPIRNTRRTISDLCASGVAPYVMTTSGPVLATVPFVKGFDDLYEISLENGQKFLCTAYHRVLSIHGGFCRASDLQIGSVLQGYEISRPRSILECGQSVQPLSGERLRKITLGSQCCCRMYRRSCDERSPLDEEFFQAISPLQAGAHECTRHCSCGDDPPISQGRIHSYQSSFRPSIGSRGHLDGYKETSLSVRAFEDNPGRGVALFQLASQFSSKTCLIEPTGLPDRDYENMRQHSCSKYTVQPVAVSRIRCIGRHPFYDLCVPDVHHYFAEGAIHHNSGKTYASALFACAWFLASPQNACVTLTSTSKTVMGSRVWAVIKDLYSSAYHPDTNGPFDWHLINSRKIVQHPRGDEKHNIACFAVEEGELLKSIDKIKGRHTERMLLEVDESNTTPAAIFNVIPNMLKGCRELVILVIGNAVSYFDNHGRACEPKDGWQAVSVDDERWLSKGVSEWHMNGGLCCHYDGCKSPNVLAGKTIYPHIYSYENWSEARKWGENSIHYWSQDRGFWPPEGTVNTVFSDPLISRCDGTGFLDFVSGRIVYAFLDPGFGGDRCVLQFADVGLLASGMTGIQLRMPIYLDIRVDKEEERDYQIARRTIEECKAKGVRPSQFGMDATAIGRGVMAIIAAEWSGEILRVEWGGKASENPSSQADGRPSDEIYCDRVTELWFRAREFLEAGQLKGLYVEAVRQATSREYKQQGRRYELNSKPECKKKLGYSPDEFDACAGICEVVRNNGVAPMGKISALSDTGWNEIVRESEKQLALADDSSAPDRIGFMESDVGIDWRD
jgi:hypothetical protein